MATSDRSQHNDIDIISLWHGLRRSMRTLLMVTLLVGVATFGVLSLLTPRYSSEAQLAISAKATNPFPDAKDGKKAPDSLTQRLDREAINTHVNALKAPDLLLKVARDLKLHQRAEFGGDKGRSTLDQLLASVGLSQVKTGEASAEQVIKVIRQRLQVVAARESRFIAIGFSSSNPKLAAAFVNTLAETYRQGLVDAPVNETQQVVNALLPKIEQLKKELLVSEAAVERFRAETDQVRAGAQATPVNARRMAALNDELIKMESARSAAESKWKTAKELRANGGVDSLPEVQASPVIQRLTEQRVQVERQVAEARASLLPAHPRMKQLNSDLGRVRTSIRQEVENVIRSLQKEFLTADFRVQDIRREIATLKTKVVDTSENEARLKSLESSARSKRSELERLQRQLEDNKTLVVTKSVPIEAQIVSFGRPSSEPVFPKKVPYTLLAMVAALILGLAVVTAKEIILAGSNRRPGGATDRKNHSTPLDDDHYDLEPVAPQPVPTLQLAGSRPPAEPVPVAQTGAPITEIAAHLIEKGDGIAGYRSILVGEQQAIDPSFEGMRLVRELSRSGKQVVIVDWNIEGEAFSEPSGITANHGILDLLQGKATFEEIVHNVPKSRAHYIAAGRGLEFEDQELDADGLNAVLDALDEAYDQVVVVGRYGAAQALFEAVQGRFDSGIVVSEEGQRQAVIDDGDPTFLGFEVTDIDIVQCIRPAPAKPARTGWGRRKPRMEMA
jgi:succinoglycan biosynthesis transport protein ExoP